MPRLAITLQDGTTTEVEVALPFFSIGRGREATIQVRDRTLSKRHAKFFRTRFGYHVVDVGSRNGTLVNGKRVAEQLLRPGDRLQLGKIKARWIEDEMAGETRPPMPRHAGEGAAGTTLASQGECRRWEGGGGSSPPPDSVAVEGFEPVDAGTAPPPPPRGRPERAPGPAVPGEAEVPEIRAVPEVWPTAPRPSGSPAALEPLPAFGSLPFFEAVHERPAGADAIDAALARIRSERGDSSRSKRWWEKELATLASLARARGRVPALVATGFVAAAFLLVTTSRLASDRRWVEGSEEVLPGLLPEDGEPASSARGGEEEAFRRAVLLARSQDSDPAAARDALADYLARYPASPRRPEAEAELARLERRTLALAAAPGAARLAYAERAHARGDLLVALEAYELAAATSQGEESRQAARRAAELRQALRARFEADRRGMETLAREGNAEEARGEFERLAAEYPLPEFVEEARRALEAALASPSPGTSGETRPDTGPGAGAGRPVRLSFAAACRRVREHLASLEEAEALAIARGGHGGAEESEFARLEDALEREGELIETVRERVRAAGGGTIPAGTLPGSPAGARLAAIEDAGIVLALPNGETKPVPWKEVGEEASYKILRANLPSPLSAEIYLALAAFAALRDREDEMAKNIRRAGFTDPAAKEKGEELQALRRSLARALREKGGGGGGGKE